MKTIDEFFSYLNSLDVKLWVEDNRLRCHAPEAVLTPSLSTQISERKAEIIEFFTQAELSAHLRSLSIVPIPRQGHPPLSFAQQRLWFIDQMEPNSSFYNIPGAVRLIGSLNVTALEQAIGEIIRRHEVLRTTFPTIEGQPVQMIHPFSEWMLPVLDLQHLSTGQREREVLHLISQEAQKPFNLAEGSLLRITVLCLDESEYILLLTMHHIIGDAWSIGVFLKELAVLYTAFSQEQASLLPELPIQYADFTAWQRQWLQGEVLETQLAYWRQQLGGSLPVLQLPTDLPRPRVQTFRGASQSFCLSPELTQALKVLSQKEEATLFMTLLTAFKILLYRYTYQEDLLVGSPIANRNRVEIEGLIGFFVNTLVLRTDLSGNPTFRELLGRVRRVTWEAYDHQDLPFEKLVEELQPERDLSYSPLFQTMFAMQNTSDMDVLLPGLTSTTLPQSNSTAKLDLIVDMRETSTGLMGVFEYNTDLFDDQAIARMANHLQNLLLAIVNHPEQRIAELPLLTTVEQSQLLVRWNHTQTEYPQNLCFHQLFTAQAEQRTDAVAVVFQDQYLTYRELNQRANQLAHYLQQLGVVPETIVGICVERSLEMIVAFLAILKAGGAYLPLDPAYPQERLAFMLSDSQIPILLTTQNLVAKLPNYPGQIICLDTNGEKIAQQSQENPTSDVTINNLAYLIYTSGSTGTPKGVLVPHEGLVNLTQDKIRTCRVQPNSRILQFFSFSFDASIPEILMALGSGAALHLATPEELLPGTALMRLLRKQVITHMTILPSALTALTPEDLPALQMVLVGGEAPSGEMIAQWSKGRLFINAYGPTETTVNASMVECGNGGQISPTIRPSANKQLYILDKYHQLVPVGVVGEVYIGGVGLARGYLNRPEKTAAAFISHPFSNQPGSRLYRTGDLAYYLKDGNIKLLGRVDHQVKIRGFRIELGEVEALLTQHPAIRENVVVVREDRPGDKRLVAYVVPESKIIPTTSDLRRFMEKKLPKYMVPAVFVVLEALPLNPNGKVDRRALPAPDTMRPELEAAFVAPRTPTESVLAGIFAEILQVERVGVNDDFFELGGHSLLATKLIAHLLKAFQVELTVMDLFEAPTVAGLAEPIENRQTTGIIDKYHDETLALLTADALLDSTIYPPSVATESRDANSILLTGATGFLGAFLLEELLQQTSATIYCLVRANDITSARQKLRKCWESYLIWDENYSDRIIPMIGDLSQPFLGLAETEFHKLAESIDVIYHNGAWVHHASPYSLLKATNVCGTQEVLRLACQVKAKPVHFMSASSVFAAAGNSGVRVIREQDNIDDQVPLGGYNQSKWVAEKLINQAGSRGLPVYIYRLGRISGHSQTGVFNVNDFLYRLIIGSVQLGCIPDQEMMLDIIPIDYASKAIVHLSTQSIAGNQVFHFVHPQPVSAKVLFEQLRSHGYSIQEIAYDQWHKQLMDIAENSPEHALYPLVSLFPSRISQTQTSNTAVLQFDCQNTLNRLTGTSITCPPINEHLLNTYISYLIQSGNIPNPTLNQDSKKNSS
ncbi:amino acid adenylation domain-containing protein [Anabaena cylindrica UHCC 0172]|uniref:non-ribosomal peptide synthetase n=1 Tax=Anabaena cylindrica TaxID=1165 RepID=UPI002B1EE797|nr:non-ribosomal peptide synthetase [Anabaena cylindrica]MEA5552711.1 amino acid adenylation domain-containing protein [Anabaena cylindrica UHCC 0172]